MTHAWPDGGKDRCRRQALFGRRLHRLPTLPGVGYSDGAYPAILNNQLSFAQAEFSEEQVSYMAVPRAGEFLGYIGALIYTLTCRLKRCKPPEVSRMARFLH